MEIKEVTYSNGNTFKYKIMNGTAYHVETNDKVVNILENARMSKRRIRVFYGDIETGKCWNEEYDVIGRVSRSCGEIKVPLLIHNSNSSGGGHMLDNCIVRITIDKVDMYKHKNFHNDNFNIKQEDDVFSVRIEEEVQARFKKLEQAERYVKFLKGERNIK